MEEIRQAVSAEMQICSGKADGLLEQKIADISKQMKSILAEIDLEQFQRVPLYEQYMAKEISKEDYESACAAYEAESHILDKKLTVLMDEKRMYEKAFNIRNPWVTLFTLSSVHREFDRRTISKLVQKIEVFSNHGEIKVVLTPLMNEWKQLLPTEFLKEE